MTGQKTVGVRVGRRLKDRILQLVLDCTGRLKNVFMASNGCDQ